MKRKFLSAILLTLIGLTLMLISVSALSLMGDVNIDGNVTAADARIVLRISVGLEDIQKYNFYFADINKDGKITAADARLVLRTSVGLDDHVEHIHNYKNESCTSPNVCLECGVSEEDVSGHTWKIATCTAPKTCSKCGATEGYAAGHNWMGATCTTPKTCKTCGKTEGTAANHSYNNNGTCTKCGTVLPEATEYITFNDVFLENYVKQSLGIQGTNKVSKYAMSKLTSFDIGENVTDVQDLKYATNLQSISINADNVKNLNVLCNLSKITYVSFGFWKKIDITFMKDMNNVERIDFNNAEIVGGDISYLIASPKLKDLFYYHPSGSGIEFLQGANALESLELWHAFGGNSDISVLKTLPKLKRLKILTYNSTSDAQRAVYAELMSKGVSVNFM